MTSPASDGDVQPRRIDRILAFMALGLTILAIISVFAIMLARPLGVTDFSEGIWPVVTVLPLIALPLAFAMILALLIMTFVRRNRANRGPQS